MRCIDCISWCLLFHFVWAAKNSLIKSKLLSLPLSLSDSLSRTVIIQSSAGKLIIRCSCCCCTEEKWQNCCSLGPLEGAPLDKQEVPIAIDKERIQNLHPQSEQEQDSRKYLWIRPGVGQYGKGGRCSFVHEFGILYRRMEDKATARHALSHTSISHTRTPTPLLPLHTLTRCDCVWGVGKSKQVEKDNRANKTWAKNPRKSSGKLKFCQFFVGVYSMTRRGGMRG